MGMNSTLSRSENQHAWGVAWCNVMQIAIHAVLPQYPTLVGYSISDYGGNGLCAVPT